MKELVIDVSHIDKTIDIAEWKRRRGIWAVIVKCGGYEDIGSGYPEQFQTRIFEQHYRNTVNNGLHVGAYYYSVATDVATMRANADHCASLLKGKSFDMPIYLDVEDRGQLGIGRRVLTDAIIAFIRRMQEHGYEAGLYTYRSMLNESMYGKELEPYPLWVAEYSDRCRTDIKHGMWQFGAMNIDGDVYRGDKSGYVDANWCYVDYPGKKQGGSATLTKVSIADIAARIHYDMVTDPRNGYSQKPERWGGDYGGTKTLNLYGHNYTYKLGSYDCSSSEITAWRLALQGTPYEGALDGATYTSDMQAAFVNSGLFTASLTPAKRGDLYLTPGDHTAMCQDGGSDGVFGYDCLSEFNMNEYRGASYGKPGDQTGYESVFRAYYDRPWKTVLHYNGKADYYINTGGVMKITPHCQTFGWRNTVTETDVVGTTGQSKALEGLRFELPEGVEFELWVHIQHGGDIYYHRVAKGLEKFVYGSANAGIRMEAIRFHVTKNDNPATRGKTLQYRAHIQGKGWLPWVSDGEWAGTRGEAKRLEAFQCRWV